MTIQDVAKELKLDWHTVKALDKEYMEKQLCRYPVAAPRVIGIDEVSMRKWHTYRIVVSDLERHWDGMAAYSRPENKVSLGFVEGLNNKIRVIQRRAYGIRDE